MRSCWIFTPGETADCATILPSVLLDDNAIFAGGGKVTFDQLLDKDGAAIEELVYPTSAVRSGSSAVDVRWGSFSIEAEFADGDEIAVHSECVSFSSPNLLR